MPHRLPRSREPPSAPVARSSGSLARGASVSFDGREVGEVTSTAGDVALGDAAPRGRTGRERARRRRRGGRRSASRSAVHAARRGCRSELSTRAALSRVQHTERIDAAAHATMPDTNVQLVAETVGQPLDRGPRRDRVSLQVQFAVDLAQASSAGLPGPARRAPRTGAVCRARGFAVCGATRRNGRRPAPESPAKAVRRCLSDRRGAT